MKTDEQETSNPIEIIRSFNLRNINISKRTDDERNVCKEKLTKMEIWNALNSMRNSKSPGNDGLSKEFYVCFFQEIHSYLLDTLNLSFTHEHISNSQSQAIITLIEKKGKDKRFLKTGGLSH